MPNHVANKLILVGTNDEIVEVLKKIRGEGKDNYVEFNNIIPMPPELHEVSSPVKIVTEAQMAEEIAKAEEMKKNNPQMYDLIGRQHGITKKMQKEYLKKYGADNWYDFACNNWGTKWGAYSQEAPVWGKEPDGRDNVTLYFETAWSTPLPIVEALSKMFPNIIMRIRWADEDVSYNIGVIKFLDGKILEEIIPDGGTVEAYKLYFEMHPGYEENFVFENGTYVWKSEEE